MFNDYYIDWTAVIYMLQNTSFTNYMVMFTVFLWFDLAQCFQNVLILATLTPQAAISGILDSASNDFIIKTLKYL